MKRLLILSLILFCFTSGYSQETKKTITASSTDLPVKKDGLLTESAWKAAVPVSGFTQRELQEGEKATEKTEVRVIYDKENIYVGIKCYDSEPDKIINKELKRDGSISSDDNVAIVLDTYRDFRSGFYFETNPNGARGDGLITDQEHINRDWNGVWDAGAAITEYGWSVEIIIPIKTLRFPNKKESVWGFNVRRKIKRKEEEVLWLSWKRNNGLMQLSEAGLLSGLNNIKMRQKVELKPYILGGSEKTLTSGSDSFEYGLDAKYPISSNLVLDLTVNTDFAQVEADRTQINLSRFSIKYPEKRDFFLEGADIFKFGLRVADVFYTRRIGISPDRKQVPIIGGARLSGKIGDYRIGMLNMQTDRKNGMPSTNYSVLRVKKDVLEKSSVGFIATNLYSNGGHDNQAVGVDFLYNTSSFRGNNNIIAGAAVSATYTNGKGKDNIAGTFFFDYPNDQADHYFEYSVVPEGFNPEIGYVQRAGIKKYRAMMRWMPRPNIPLVKRITLKPVSMGYYTDMHGKLLTRDNEIRPVGIEFKSGDELEFNIRNKYEYLYEDHEVFGDVTIPKGSYDWWFYEIQFQTSGKRKFSFDLETTWGNYFVTGKRTAFEPGINVKLNENIAVSTQYSYSKISINNRSFETKEYSGRLTLNYSTRLTSRTFVQWNNEDKRFYINFLINYIPKIGSDIYFVYNQIWDGMYNYRIHSKTGIAKIAYLFRF